MEGFVLKPIRKEEYSKHWTTQCHKRTSRKKKTSQGWGSQVDTNTREMRSNWYSIIQAGVTTRKAFREPHYSK